MWYSGLSDWRRKNARMRINLRDKILTADSLEEIWWDIFTLYVLCSFTGLQDVARALLEAYFDAHPGSKPDRRLPTQQAVESIWRHAEATKPRNSPWEVVELDRTQGFAQYDIGNPAFYQFYKWTTVQVSDDSYDPHQWKNSEDPEVHATCARLLCRVPEGQIPDRTAIEEAFEAVDRLFMELPRTSTSSHFNWKFPIPVYFCLAVGLGKREKARKIFELACQPEEWCPDVLLPIPALYEVYLGDAAAADPDATPLIAQSDATSAATCLTQALIQRRQTGRQEPLHGVGWPELLRRFTEAAFTGLASEYAEIEDPPQRPSDILLPPITPDKLAEVEQRLGPLPPDLREMVQVANGFKGTWHFAGGGFAGVDKLLVRPSDDYEIFLGILPEPRVSTRTVTKPDGTTQTVTVRVHQVGTGQTEGMGAGPVWVGPGTVENDDFEHVICPPETWRKLVETGRTPRRSKNAEGNNDNEYSVTYYAHWTAGDDDGYRSMRHWIASETASMERELEIGQETKH
ncbi:hypothetical protein BR93DRAFT_930860 [Coniochaeta sp. PMI_546]|nr:hypothetical protein BR93DRAFT_930860 [Coniochaeta sp. PMI_546]